MSQKIRIKLKSYDHNLVDKSAEIRADLRTVGYRLLYLLGLLSYACSNNGNGTGIGLAVIAHRAHDKVNIVTCDVTYEGYRVIRVKQRDLTGNIDDDIGRARDGSLKKR